MKAKFLPLLLLAILLQVSMFSFANEMTSARRIRLKNKTEVQHRSIPVTPDACIENSLLSIDLLSTVPTVTVIIKNAETDEVVYTSTDLMESSWIEIQDITYALIRIKPISQNWCDQLSNY